VSFIRHLRPPHFALTLFPRDARWACLCERDQRWAARARGVSDIRNMAKDPFVVLIKRYSKIGLQIPLPSDPPRSIATLVGGPGRAQARSVGFPGGGAEMQAQVSDPPCPGAACLLRHPPMQMVAARAYQQQQPPFYTASAQPQGDLPIGQALGSPPPLGPPRTHLIP
jgi:hypothetical protein